MPTKGEEDIQAAIRETTYVAGNIEEKQREIEDHLEKMNAKLDWLPSIKAEVGLTMAVVAWVGFAACILLALILWRIW